MSYVYRWFKWGDVWHRDDPVRLSLSLCDAYFNLMRSRSSDYIERRMDEMKRRESDPPSREQCYRCRSRIKTPESKGAPTAPALTFGPGSAVVGSV